MAAGRHRGGAAVRQTPAVAFTDLAAEVQTEVRLLRVTEAELAVHAVERENA